MSELREPLEHVTTCYKAFDEAFCALVEAVGVMESEDTELAEVKTQIASLRGRLENAISGAGVVIEGLREEVAEAKMTIQKVRTRLERERDQTLVSVKRLREQRDEAERELAKAKAEIKRLRKRLADIGEGGGVAILNLHRELDAVGRELVAALAEIPRLEKERDEAKAEIGSWMHRCHELERLLADHKASHADAEIGRLVRGMRVGTRLWRISDGYMIGTKEEADGERGCWVWRGKIWNDPAEALRSIQASGDDNGL